MNPENLRLLADHHVLNFINTIDPREGPHQVDHLPDFDDLLAWAKRARVVNESDARKIGRDAARNPRIAAQAFSRALELRETLYLVFLRVVAGQSPPPDALAELMRAHRDALAHGAFVRSGKRFQWVLPVATELVRWRIAQDAIALLESAELTRVKRCPGSGDCGWLFLDTSKNATRRWCSMEGCGNRAKMRRFLHRKQARARARKAMSGQPDVVPGGKRTTRPGK